MCIVLSFLPPSRPGKEGLFDPCRPEWPSFSSRAHEPRVLPRIQVIALQYNCFLVACAFPARRRHLATSNGFLDRNFCGRASHDDAKFQLVNERATQLSRDSSYLSFFRPRVVPRHARVHRATALLRTAARSGTANDERGALPMRVLCLCTRVLVPRGGHQGKS